MATRSPSILLRLARTGLALFSLVAIGMAGRCHYAFRDRNPGYTLDLNIDPTAGRALRAGFGRVEINPDLSDPGRPVWLAGFSQNRAATAIHDDLWAVASVIDDGQTRIGIVALDAIGFFHDDVVEVRRRLSGDWKIDYAIVCSTHNHSTPDLMGLWGPSYLRTGVDLEYREKVIEAAVRALGAAVQALSPARVAFHKIEVPPAGLVADTRKPEVFDPDIRVMHLISAEEETTLGTLVTWGNHPETPWSKNTEITADFCGVLRDALEHGVRHDGQLIEPGVGGIHLFINGAVGGLMTTSPSVAVEDPYTRVVYQEPSHAKSRAVGHQLASRILPLLKERPAPFASEIPLTVQARTIDLPLDNKAFLLAPVLGLIDRGHVRWREIRTEVALLTLGPASIACIPGEIYPEIVNGGVERAPGADFDIEPVEVPPLRELMPGQIKFIFGLANDEIGYIIPKSQWDEKAPYLYHSNRPVYGEINSPGPETAGILHKVIAEMCLGLESRSSTPAGAVE
jgi:hypothetical protein